MDQSRIAPGRRGRGIAQSEDRDPRCRRAMRRTAPAPRRTPPRSLQARGRRLVEHPNGAWSGGETHRQLAGIIPGQARASTSAFDGPFVARTTLRAAVTRRGCIVTRDTCGSTCVGRRDRRRPGRARRRPRTLGRRTGCDHRGPCPGHDDVQDRHAVAVRWRSVGPKLLLVRGRRPRRALAPLDRLRGRDDVDVRRGDDHGALARREHLERASVATAGRRAARIGRRPTTPGRGTSRPGRAGMAVGAPRRSPVPTEPPVVAQ